MHFLGNFSRRSASCVSVLQSSPSENAAECWRARASARRSVEKKKQFWLMAREYLSYVSLKAVFLESEPKAPECSGDFA